MNENTTFEVYEAKAEESNVVTYECDKCGMSYGSRRALHEHQTKAGHHRGRAMTLGDIAFVIAIILALKFLIAEYAPKTNAAPPDPPSPYPRIWPNNNYPNML